MRDCPNFKIHDKGCGQAQVSSCSDVPYKNCFYSLRSRGEQETSPDVVTDMLNILFLMCMRYLNRVLICPLLHH